MIPFEYDIFGYILTSIFTICCIVFVVSLINKNHRHIMTYFAILSLASISLFCGVNLYYGDTFQHTIKICNIAQNGHSGIVIIDYDENVYNVYDLETSLKIKQGYTYNVQIRTVPFERMRIDKIYQSNFVCNGVDNC